MESAYTQGGKRRNQAKGEMRAGPPAERSLRGQAVRQSRSNKVGKANAWWARLGRVPRVGQRQIITGPPRGALAPRTGRVTEQEQVLSIATKVVFPGERKPFPFHFAVRVSRADSQLTWTFTCR